MSSDEEEEEEEGSFLVFKKNNLIDFCILLKLKNENYIYQINVAKT